MDKHIVELLTCAMCLDRLKQPKVLPCQHTFCLSPCLPLLVKNGKVRCAECNKEHDVPSDGISGFPNNLTIVKFMKSPISNECAAKQSCQKCKGENVLFGKCLCCNNTLCRRCLTEHTDTLRSLLKDSVSKILEKSNTVSRKISQIQQMKKRLKENEARTTEDIQKWYCQCVLELQSKKNKFIEDVKVFTEQESGILEDKRENLEMELAVINSICDSANTLNRRPPTSYSVDEEQNPLFEMIQESKRLLQNTIEEIKTEKFTEFSDVKANDIVKTVPELQCIEIRNRPAVPVETEQVATEEMQTQAENFMDSPPFVCRQPPGEMKGRTLESTLPGCGWFTRTMEITYSFPEGCMNGVNYASTEYKAYFPTIWTDFSQDPLYLRLQKAFYAKQVFKLEHDPEEITGKIVWGDIPHKTNISGGQGNDGYPDNEYLDKLLQVLKAKGF